MNDMRLEFLKKLVSYFVFFLLIVKSCYKINKIEQCKDVKGTRSWIHSEMYRGTSNKKLIASTYNGLGTNQTTACIRVQAGNAKLIYDIAKTNRYSIPIRIYRSSNKGPFGKITLNDTTGKIPGNQNYDPTDPAFKNKR